MLITSGPALAKDYLNEQRTIGGAPQSKTERFTFTIGKDSLNPHLDLTIAMTQGRADLRILDPAGATLYNCGATACTLSFPIPGATQESMRPS